MKRGCCHQITDSKSGITLVQYNDNNVVQYEVESVLVQRKRKISLFSNHPVLLSIILRGVDHLDQNVCIYRTSTRMMKWHWRVIMFTLNASMNNAYQLHHLGVLRDV